MNILITRQHNLAYETKQRIDALSCNSLILPMLKIEQRPLNIPNKKYDAIIFTSQNAIFTIHHNRWMKNLCIYTIGQKNKERLLHLGCKNVKASNLDAKTLSKIIANEQQPHSKILYCHGNYISFDIASQLIEMNVIVNSVEVYKTEYLQQLTKNQIDYMARSDVILSYSKNTTKNLFSLIKKHEIDCSHKTLICISTSCQGTIPQDITWKLIKIADQPNEYSVIRCVKEHIASLKCRQPSLNM